MGLLNLLKKIKKGEYEANIILLGLDNAGKSSILHKLANIKEEIRYITPTQGI